MPTISETIQEYENDILEMIAEQWGIEEDINPKKSIKQQIASLISNLDLFLEIIDTLP